MYRIEDALSALALGTENGRCLRLFSRKRAPLTWPAGSLHASEVHTNLPIIKLALTGIKGGFWSHIRNP